MKFIFPAIAFAFAYFHGSQSLVWCQELLSPLVSNTSETVMNIPWNVYGEAIASAIRAVTSHPEFPFTPWIVAIVSFLVSMAPKRNVREARNSSRRFAGSFLDCFVPFNRLYIRRGFQNARTYYGFADHKAFPWLRVQHFTHVDLPPLVSIPLSHDQIHDRVKTERGFYRTPTLVTTTSCHIHDRSLQ